MLSALAGPQSPLEFGCPLTCSSLLDLQVVGCKLPFSIFSIPLGNTPPVPVEEGRDGSGPPSLIPAKPTQGQESGGTRQGNDLRIFSFLGIFTALEDSKKIPSISVLFPGAGGQQKAATFRSSCTGSSCRGSQENGTVLLVAKWLPSLSCCPGSPWGVCAP